MLSQVQVFRDGEDGGDEEQSFGLQRLREEKSERRRKKYKRRKKKYKIAPERQRERMIRCENSSGENREKCLFVCSFVHSFARPFVRSFVYSFVRSFVRSSIRSFDCAGFHVRVIVHIMYLLANLFITKLITNIVALILSVCNQYRFFNYLFFL